MTSSMTLPTDGPVTAQPLADYLAAWAGADDARRALADLIRITAEGSIPLAGRLAMGKLPGDPTAIVGSNESGDKVKALDLASHLFYVDLLRTAPVAHMLSEESEEVIALNPGAPYDIAIDPIDGSGSIGVGAPLGALFGIFPAGESFLRKGTEMIAAGYVSFGHSCDLVFTLGEGVVIATLDPAQGVYFIDAVDERLKEDTSTIAYNASNLRRWSAGLQAYVEDLLLGKDGPRGKNFNMRWLGAAVGDLHRILRRGGLFMYPSDKRPGYDRGHLRMLYECFPMALLIEQAGGTATDGVARMLDQTPDTLHAKTPLFFGSKNEMATLMDYLSRDT